MTTHPAALGPGEPMTRAMPRPAPTVAVAACTPWGGRVRAVECEMT